MVERVASRIDVHAHYLPGPYLERLRAGGGRVMSPPHDQKTLDLLVAGQDAAGVSSQILSTGPHSPYLQDVAAAVDCARQINDFYCETVERSNGRFAAFGSVPLPHTGAASAEGCRCLDDLGFAGIHLGCSIRGRPLDDPEFDEFWRELDQREAIVFVHPGGILLGEPGLAGMDDPMISISIGSAAEMATATIRLIRLRQRFTKIQFIICILGGVIPFLYERLNEAAMTFGRGTYQTYTSRPLIEELRGFYYDTTLDDDVDALVKARQVYGVDRLLLGSDAPRKPPMTAIEFVQAAGFPMAECNAIVDQNAAKLLGHRLSHRAA